MRCRAPGERRLIVPCHSVNLSVTPPSSRSVPGAPVLAYYSDLSFNSRTAARLEVCIAQVEHTVSTTSLCFHCTFCGVKVSFGLHLRLMKHYSIFIDLSSAVVADIDNLGLLNIVRGTRFDAATSIVAFERLQDLDWSAMGLSSPVRRLFCQQADDSVLTGFNCPRVEFVWRHRPLMTWLQVKGAAAEFSHFVDGVLISLFFDDHPPLMPRVSTVSPSAPFPVSPVSMNDTCSSSTQIRLTTMRTVTVRTILPVIVRPICCCLAKRR